MKNLFKKENLFLIVFILVVLHPIIELDYLFNYFNISFPFIRFTTIIDFIVLPILVIILFTLFEKNKKKVLVPTLIFGLIFIIYFILHVYNSNKLQYDIHLPNNFIFTIKDEIIYTITLMLPLAYIYIFNLKDVTDKLLKRIIVSISSLISIPILLSNLFLFGMSTYQGYVKDTFLSWFLLPYNDTSNHPRLYATKFFFEEGNTIGILLFIILPLLYYFMFKEKNKKSKVFLVILIFIQSLSMIILTTRIATYGAPLVAASMIALYVFTSILKFEKFKLVNLFIPLLVFISCASIIPFCPAYQNQLIDAQNYSLLNDEDDTKKDGSKLLRALLEEKDTQNWKWTKPWQDFYVYMFEDYYFLIGVTPPIYYTTWYSYKYDPQFWVDLMFDYELSERINGRQIQTIFSKYKWQELSFNQKLTGFGYSTFMNGGIVLEKDFEMQFYMYGFIGFILTMLPYILIYMLVAVLLLINFKKWNLKNLTLLVSITFGYASSYVSGHTFDELTTSLVISLFISILLKDLIQKKN